VEPGAEEQMLTLKYQEGLTITKTEMAVKEIEKMMTEIGEEEVCHVIETGKGGSEEGKGIAIGIVTEEESAIEIGIVIEIVREIATENANETVIEMIVKSGEVVAIEIVTGIVTEIVIEIVTGTVTETVTGIVELVPTEVIEIVIEIESERGAATAIANGVKMRDVIETEVEVTIAWKRRRPLEMKNMMKDIKEVKMTLMMKRTIVMKKIMVMGSSKFEVTAKRTY